MENQNFNNPNQQPPQGGFYQQPALPNSTGVLVMGILSIVFCWTYGLVGLILGIIALALSSKANILYQQNPNMYSIASYKNMKAGRVCAIIGTVISGIWLLFVVIMLAFVGTVLTSLPWDQWAR